MTEPNYGVATPAHETGPWQGPTLEEWLARFRDNASVQVGGSPRVPVRQRAAADRSAVAFPMVQREVRE
jgi:hypothetical protein